MTFNYRMHERNLYKVRPDFSQIALDFPDFRKYAIPDERGKIRVDFTDTNALKMLTQILLKKDFNLSVEIPDGFLIPTIPQRLNYILWIEDLLCCFPKRSAEIHGIDIGTGPCAIFSLLGARTNNWKFTSTECSDEALQWAVANIKRNNLQNNVNVVKVSNTSVLSEILSASEIFYDFCLCNPPFFESIEEIRRKTVRSKIIAEIAKKEEIFAEGGEITFVKNLIKDSLVYRNKVCLYSSMFGKKKSFLQILNELKGLKDVKFTTTEFCQGNTVRWGIAWTFMESVHFKQVKKVKPQKAKKALIHKISHQSHLSIRNLLNKIESILQQLQIQVKITHCTENYMELQMQAEKNTWSHQRRKRRELFKKNMLNERPACSLSHDCATLPSECSICMETVNIKDTELCSNTESGGDNATSSDIIYTKGNDTFIESVKCDSFKTVENSMKKIRSTLQNENLSCNKLLIAENSESNCTPEVNAPSEEYTTFSSSSHFNTDFVHKNKMYLHEYGNESMSVLSTNVDSEKKNSFCSCKRKIESDEVSSINKQNSSRCASKSCFRVSNKPLLFCSLKLIKTKDSIIFKMNCPPEYERESMHQVFVFIKNKKLL